jgi:hypothetical protein
MLIHYIYLERNSRTRLTRPNSSSFLQNNKPYDGLQFYGPINMHNTLLWSVEKKVEIVQNTNTFFC